MTRFLWTATGVLVLVSNAIADPIPWKDGVESERVRVEGNKDEKVLNVAGLAEPTNTQFLTLDADVLKKALTVDGKVNGTFYVTGKVRYEGVSGSGYLEMWTHYADGGMYFSRTLGDSGPMGKLSGTSDWREVILPFQGPPGTLPSKVTIGVVLPGKGKVWLEPMTIKPAVSKASRSWLLLIPTAGLPLLGILLLAIVPRTRPIARPLAIAGAALAAFLVLLTLLLSVSQGGLGSFAAEAIVVGIVATLICASIAIVLRRTTEDELRRMRAMDTAGV